MTLSSMAQTFFQAGDVGLKDCSRCPHTFYRKTPNATEELVLKIFADTGYGFRRVAKQRKKITIRKTGRRYYNPLDFAPFEFLQADVKEVIDGDTLPTETYTHLLELAKRNVPLYQFTAIDIRTSIRFLAYGQQKSFSNTWAFLVLVMLWIHYFGIKHKTVIQNESIPATTLAARCQLSMLKRSCQNSVLILHYSHQ